MNTGTSFEDPLPPVPAPFQGSERRFVNAGCSRSTLIGCGAIFVIFGLAGVIFVTQATDLFEWTLRRFEQQIFERLPSEVTEQERARLGEAFDSARRAVREGEIDPTALRELQRLLAKTADPELSPSRQDVLRLIETLEAVRASEPVSPDGGEASVAAED